MKELYPDYLEWLNYLKDGRDILKFELGPEKMFKMSIGRSGKIRNNRPVLAEYGVKFIVTKVNYYGLFLI